MLIGAFLVAFIATATLVPLVGMAARALGLFAKPTEDRWHAMPVPHFGGVAMMVALLAVLQVGGLIPALWPLVMTTVLMSAIGLVDDLRPMRPATKLVLQLAASALLIYFVPPVRITGQPVVDLLLAFLWMVGITNAFNLLDNIDGLAGGVAAIVGGSFLALLRLHGGDALTPLAIATSAFVGTTLGFLIYNFKPASIFMGDSGSHAIGAFIAGATLLAAPSLKTGVMPVGLVPVVLLLIPIFDTAFVTLTRRLAGRSAFRGGRDHTSHRLVALGLGERPAVITLYALTMAGGAVAIGIERLQPGVSWGFVGMYVAGLAVVGVYLGHIPSATDGQSLEAPPLPSELTNRYRIYEVLLDIVLVTSAYYLAFLIRFREPEFSYFLPFFTGSLPIVVVTQVVTLWLSGKYRQVWRTLGPSEMLGLIRGSLAGVGASVIAVVYINRFEGYSRSVFAFDAMLAAMFLIVARVGLGALDESLRRRRASRGMALIYGAGRGGALTMRELLQNGDIGLMPVGFLDDDPSKRRLRIEGFPVLGSLEDLPAILARPASRISVVIVSVLGLPRDKSDRVCAICAERGVEVRRFRFALESVDATTPAAGVVRFKRP